MAEQMPLLHARYVCNAPYMFEIDQVKEAALTVLRELKSLEDIVEKGLLHNCNICGAQLSVSIAKDGSGKSISYDNEFNRLKKDNENMQKTFQKIHGEIYEFVNCQGE